MVNIKVVAKESHNIISETTTQDTVSLVEPSVVVVGVSKNDVSEIKVEGVSVVLYLKNGQIITLENFFSETEPTDNSLVFEDEDSKLLWVQFIDSNGEMLTEIAYSPISKIEPLLYHDGAIAWAWALPIAATGWTFWDKNHKNNKKESDNTPPEKPSNVKIAEDGKTVTGKAEPGSKVDVTDQDGKVIGSGTADDKGDFTITLEPPLTNGETVEVTATDKSGNKSKPTEATATDTTAPNAPSPVEIAEDGKTVTGKAEPGSKVDVTNQDGKVIGSGTADDKGDFTITLEPPLTNGETVEVTATDKSGNKSEPTEATATDTTGPALDFTVTINADGSATISGTTEPGASVVITDPNGNNVPVTVAADGTITGTIAAPAEAGDYEGTATDVNGNDSTDTATATDTHDLISGTISLVNFDDTGIDTEDGISSDNYFGLSISGNSSGSTVVFQYSVDGGLSWNNVPGNGADNTYGNNSYIFRAEVTSPSGNKVEYTPTIAVTVDTLVAPPVITSIIDAVDGGLENENIPDGGLTNDARPTINGTGEVGAIVTIKDGMTVLGTAVVNTSGEWTFTPSTDLSNDLHTITASQVDIAGNVSGDSSSRGFTVDAKVPDFYMENSYEVPWYFADGDGSDYYHKDAIYTPLVGGVTQTLMQIELGENVESGDIVTINIGSSTYTYTVSEGDINNSIGIMVDMPPADGSQIPITVTISDAAGNSISDSGTLTVQSPPLVAPTIMLADDTGTDTADGITTDGTVNVDGVFIGNTWQYSIDGGVTWSTAQDSSVTSFELPKGSYNANQIQVKQTDLFGATSSVGQIASTVQIVTPISAQNDIGSANINAVNDAVAAPPSGVLDNVTRLVTAAPESMRQEFAITSNTNNSSTFTINVNSNPYVVAYHNSSNTGTGGNGYYGLIYGDDNNDLNPRIEMWNGTTWVTQTALTSEFRSKLIASNSSATHTGQFTATLEDLPLGTYRIVVSTDSLTANGKVYWNPSNPNDNNLTVNTIHFNMSTIVSEQGKYTLDADVLSDNLDIDSDLSYEITTISGHGVTTDNGATYTVVGQYGTLVVNKTTGAYTYTPNAVGEAIGKVDTFTYTVADAASSSNESLYIQIGVDGQPLAWNPADPSETVEIVPALVDDVRGNAVYTNLIESSVTHAADTTKSGTGSGAIGTGANFTVANGTTQSFGVAYDIYKGLGARSVRVTLEDSNGNTIIEIQPWTPSNTSTVSGTYQVVDLPAGTYRLRLESTGSLAAFSTSTVLIANGRVATVKTQSNDYDIEVAGTPIKGNIFANDDTSTLPVKKLEVYNGSAWVDVPAVSATTSITLAGGTLQISKDGSYSFTKSAANVDADFQYRVTLMNDATDTATLSFKQSGATNWTGSSVSDAFDSGVDSLGADSVIYKVLANNATGGNGHDTWDNFHVGTDANADIIDVSALFVGTGPTDATVANFLAATFDGTNTTVRIDRDGAGGTHTMTDLITLNNVNTTIQELLENNQIIIG